MKVYKTNQTMSDIVKKMKKLLTINEAAEMIGVTALTLRNWDNSGKFKASRHPINNYRVYRLEEIEKLIDSIKNNTMPINNRRSKKPRKLEVKHLS